MIITIAGLHGSGKSTVARTIAHRLGYEFFSSGDLRGEIAMRHGLTIDQLNEIGRTEPWTDKEVDDLLVKMGKTRDDMVFDSHLAWFFIPNSFKVFLRVEPWVAGERVFAKQRPDEQRHDTPAAVASMLSKRNKNNEERYRKWYGAELMDMANYDLVIDTTNTPVEQTIDTILKKVDERLSA